MEWFNLLPQKASDDPVYVLCSDSKLATDPKGEVAYCKYYRYPDSHIWELIPNNIKVPHPIGLKEFASGFFVKDVLSLSLVFQSILKFQIEWFSKGSWRKDGLPTRGEYLIRKSTGTKSRPVYALLELKYLYIVALKR